MTVSPSDIATELGRATPDGATFDQWAAWIGRAYRLVKARAQQFGVPYESLDPATVDDVVTYAVARRVTRPLGGAESATEQVGVDDGTWSQTRRFSVGQGDIFVLDEWWALLGLASVSEHWSGSIAYGR